MVIACIVTILSNKILLPKLPHLRLVLAPQKKGTLQPLCRPCYRIRSAVRKNTHKTLNHLYVFLCNITWQGEAAHNYGWESFEEKVDNMHVHICHAATSSKFIRINILDRELNNKVLRLTRCVRVKCKKSHESIGVGNASMLCETLFFFGILVTLNPKEEKVIQSRSFAKSVA